MLLAAKIFKILNKLDNLRHYKKQNCPVHHEDDDLSLKQELDYMSASSVGD
jgi:hypothetical protein